MFNRKCVSDFERRYNIRLTDKTIHRLMELNIVHLEWWHKIDIIKKFSLKIYNDLSNETKNNSDDDPGGNNNGDFNKFYPIFIVEKVTLIDSERIEVSHGKQYTFTSPFPSNN